jgi:hypothetical protein
MDGARDATHRCGQLSWDEPQLFHFASSHRELLKTRDAKLVQDNWTQIAAAGDLIARTRGVERHQDRIADRLAVACSRAACGTAEEWGCVRRGPFRTHQS